jgi:quercetin dioxygenase-like cupin family protein
MAPKSKNAKVTLGYQHELPNVPGKSIKGVLVEYGPGGYSPGHTHPKSAFIYATVLEGAIRSQVNNGPVTTYEAGQSFSELPGDRHSVSANASETKPAKLLAVFVVDTNETELTIPFGNVMVPIHFGTFINSLDARGDCEAALEEALQRGQAGRVRVESFGSANKRSLFQQGLGSIARSEG